MANVLGQAARQEQEQRRMPVVSFLRSASLSFLTFLPERPIITNTREREEMKSVAKLLRDCPFPKDAGHHLEKSI